MNNSEIRLPPGELVRLAECVLEPISFPDAIQPHGLLLVARAAELVITHVSDNSVEMIGADPVALMGRPLAHVLGSSAIAQLRDVLDPTHFASNPVGVQLD
ncbi:MAG: hypothetical protein ABI067_07775, partial [Leifsonia sp.]